MELEVASGLNFDGPNTALMDDVLSDHQENLGLISQSGVSDTYGKGVLLDSDTPLGRSSNQDLKTNGSNVQRVSAVSTKTHVIQDCSLLNNLDHHQVSTLNGKDPSDLPGKELVCSVCSPKGSTVNVYDACVKGNCTCVYVIGDVPCQLKPCRFAAIICCNAGWADKYADLLWNITDGFPVVDTEVPSYHCENYSSILDPQSKGKMDKIIRNELAENVISIVDYSPHCIHSLGAVPKPGGGIRPITDCSRPTGSSVNNYCESIFKEFSYKSVDDVVSILKWGYYMSVVDIKSAYRAVPILEEHRKYMGFVWELDGVKYKFVDNRLCFGLRLGPQYFQRISNFVHDVLLHFYDVKTVNYLDDFITLSRSHEGCLEAQNCILHVLRFLGFHVAYDKVSPPSTCTTFLGVEIDTVTMELRLPESKIIKLNSFLDKYVDSDRISKKDLESLGGLLSHCASLVRGGKTFCRRLYNLYKEICNRGSKNIGIPLVVKSDLQWWRVFCRTFNGVSQINNVDYHHPMISDASLKGFGVYMGHDWAAGSWEVVPEFEVQSECSHIVNPPVQDRDLVDFSNINVLELWPILVGIKRWSKILRNKSLTLFTDNTQVMHMLLKGSSTNLTCMAWIKEIYWTCVFNNIDLKPKYVNTHNNLVADTLSRLKYFKAIDEPLRALTGTDLCCIPHLLVNYRRGQ